MQGGLEIGVWPPEKKGGRAGGKLGGCPWVPRFKPEGGAPQRLAEKLVAHADPKDRQLRPGSPSPYPGPLMRAAMQGQCLRVCARAGETGGSEQLFRHNI